MTMSRVEFRERCLERDDGTCIVRGCNEEADDVHHIIERSLWGNGGYFMGNGASVCNRHHRYAEKNWIPPQAFWCWLDVDPSTPRGLEENINKWGDEFDTPSDLRDNIKYPSTGHLQMSPEWDGSRVDFKDMSHFYKIPLVVTIKMDGSNVLLTNEKVAARNAKHARHKSFDYLKQLHPEFAHEIPDHIQIFGEWLYAKHSIHYTDDIALDSYLQIFGVFDKRYNLWLSWESVEEWADKIGHPTVPVVDGLGEQEEWEFYEYITEKGEELVDQGHEGLVVRSIFPFHYDQFEKMVGKYVREGHVDPDDDHWKHREIVQNEVE